MIDLGRIDGDIRRQKRPPDLDVAELARCQHGVVARAQLLGLGFGKSAIDHRLRAGRLHLVHRGVYAVGHPLLTVHGRWMAAVLATGPRALLSHLDAAALWDMRSVGSGDIHVTIAARNRHGQRGIRVHRVRRLHPDDVEMKDGIPVTSVARTLFDSAEMLERRQLERLFEQADRLRLFDLRALGAVCERCRGRRGRRPVVDLLQTFREPPATRSELERMLVDVCREYEIPEPAFNVPVAGYEVDAWWPGTDRIAELDSYAFHSSRTAFENDRERDLDLKLAGFEVTRITHRMLTRRPAQLAQRIRRFLAAGAPVPAGFS
jgi:very-short-patch-repair endonuclease